MFKNHQGLFAPIIKIGTTSQTVQKRLKQCERKNVFGVNVNFTLLLSFPSRVDDEKKVKDMMDNVNFRNIRGKTSTEYYLAARKGFFDILSYYVRECVFRKAAYKRIFDEFQPLQSRDENKTIALSTLASVLEQMVIGKEMDPSLAQLVMDRVAPQTSQDPAR